MNVVEKSELAALARSAASGDPRALASLLDELAPLVVRTARLIAGPGSAAAEDAAQEALADLARRITTLREPEAGAVKSQLHEARRKLADALREAGFAPTARTPAPVKGRS